MTAVELRNQFLQVSLVVKTALPHLFYRRKHSVRGIKFSCNDIGTGTIFFRIKCLQNGMASTQQL